MKKINFIFYIMMIVSLLVVSCDNTEISGTKPTSTTSSTTIPGAEKCKTPTITGTTSFGSSTEVTITCDTEGAEIHYTLDGSTPGSGSTKYTGSITLTETKTVKAVAIKSGMNNSDVASKTFTKSSSPMSSAKSGVMIQGFTWASAPRGSGYSVENPNPNWYKWYDVMIGRASDLQKFEYVWCPPPSKTDSASSEGYAPTQLNDLNSFYGSATKLETMINAIKPAKAIADIVVNHRAGTTSWGDFTNPSWCEDYYAICSNDEGFTDSSSPMYGSSKKGAPDTGCSYGAYRDLDHTNALVQQGIIDWMNNVLKPAGFVGWRYDYVKGYGAEYVGQYNAATEPVFSVGEYWPGTDDGSGNYSSGNPSTWGNKIKGWISGTASNGGKRSRAFDFALKGALNDVFGCTWDGSGSGSSASNNYGLLADSSNLYISQPADAVTFIDNHDTGSTQGHWALRSAGIAPAYALILTHPGYPCVSWSHYFTYAESGSINDTYPYSGINSQGTYIGGTTVPGTPSTYRQFIDELIDLRKEIGIEYDSERTTLVADNTRYVAEIEGTSGSIITVIGNTSYTPTDTDYEEELSGTGFKVYVKREGGTPKCKTPVITITDGTVSITCATDGATIKYTTDGSDPTNGTTYSSSFSVTEGQTVKAIATKSGLDNSKVASKTYTVGISMTFNGPDWTWTACEIFCNAWNGVDPSTWIKCTGSGTTVTCTIPSDSVGCQLVRCYVGTTTPSWTTTGDTIGRIYNKTANLPISSSPIDVTFENHNP